jgi:hypothetical protein
MQLVHFTWVRWPKTHVWAALWLTADAVILLCKPLPSVYTRRYGVYGSLSWFLRAASFELAISATGRVAHGGMAYGVLFSTLERSPTRFSVHSRRVVAEVITGAGLLPLRPRDWCCMRSTAVWVVKRVRSVINLVEVRATLSSVNRSRGGV